ncbi:MAG: RimK/LysX family protein [Gammaproteobacteria bacterium]|nr:RimK/LysX family protein [Gammaproteobacteria bacterium]
MKKLFLIFLLSAFLSIPIFANGSLQKEALSIKGYVEDILIMPDNILLSAKLDSGADTSSLNAQHIRISKRSGQDWVEFDVLDKNTVHHLSYIVLKKVSIKNRSGEITNTAQAASRPLIAMDVCLGGRIEKIKVNLVDRSQFKYPFLLGREALAQYDVLIDPKSRYKNSVMPSPTNCHKSLLTY